MILKTLLQNRKGYTIIVVMIIMLLLSGLAVLALNTVNSGVKEANLELLSQQAFDTSNSAVNLFTQYAGRNATYLMGQFKKNYQELHRPGTSNNIDNWAFRLPESELMQMILGNRGSSSQELLFTNETRQKTWEKIHPTNYNIVIRDVSEGIQFPGFSEGYCFKRVLISGESTVGLTKATGENNSTFANAITAQETLIGPVRCN